MMLMIPMLTMPVLLLHPVFHLLLLLPLVLLCLFVILPDQVLQLLWKAQPDAAASNPMPYMGRMHELLLGDPYLDLLTGQGGKGVGVKLRVTEIKKLLNF
jgi:hypothetical protein